MTWAGRDEQREREEELAAQRCAEEYKRSLQEWRDLGKQHAEALLPSLKAWYEREHGLPD